MFLETSSAISSLSVASALKLLWIGRKERERKGRKGRERKEGKEREISVRRET